MSKKIEDKNKVDKKTISNYEEIDIFDVIKETLLCKGEQVCSDDGFIQKKLLEDSALYLYDLKCNATNKLFVGLTIDRLCLRNGLCHERRDTLVKVPCHIYNEVKSINDQYRKSCNQDQ